MQENNKKEITLDDLALMMREGFERSEKLTDTKIEDLARLVVERFDEVDKNIDGLKADVAGLKVTTDNIEANLNKKVDVIKHNDLVYRVEKLEKNAGLAAA